ncbi:hypothetical protein RA266_27970, partial [Pseudomonas syringae pv. tagetis]|uniref:hypothetical protein n=1 Tax=Pseudomonas syringae group genomosp. 7 TaxID=251699 RepID=UPI00376FE99C
FFFLVVCVVFVLGLVLWVLVGVCGFFLLLVFWGVVVVGRGCGLWLWVLVGGVALGLGFGGLSLGFFSSGVLGRVWWPFSALPGSLYFHYSVICVR